MSLCLWMINGNEQMSVWRPETVAECRPWSWLNLFDEVIDQVLNQKGTIKSFFRSCSKDSSYILNMRFTPIMRVEFVNWKVEFGLWRCAHGVQCTHCIQTQLYLTATRTCLQLRGSAVAHASVLDWAQHQILKCNLPHKQYRLLPPSQITRGRS